MKNIKAIFFLCMFLIIWGCKDNTSVNEPLPEGHYLIQSDMMSPYIKKHAVVATEDIDLYNLAIGDIVVIEELFCGGDRMDCITYHVAMRITHMEAIESTTFDQYRITLTNHQENYSKYVSYKDLLGKVIEVKNPK